MTKLFSNAEFTLTCGHCGHKFTETFARLEAKPDFPCPACGVVTHYDAKPLRELIDRPVKELGKTTSKPIKVKFKL